MKGLNLKKGIISVIAATAIFAQSNIANAYTYRFGNTAVSFGYIGFRLNYKSTESPYTKDKATLNGVELKIEHISSKKGVLGNSYLCITAMYAVSTKKGSLEETYLKANSTQQIERVEFAIGTTQTKQNMRLKEALVVGERWWLRKFSNIKDSSNRVYDNRKIDYGNMYAGVHLEIDATFAKHLSMGLVASGFISPSIKAINQVYDASTGTTYKMKTAYLLRLSAPIAYNYKRFFITITPFYSHWRFSGSEEETLLTEDSKTYDSYIPSGKEEEIGIDALIGVKF